MFSPVRPYGYIKIGGIACEQKNCKDNGDSYRCNLFYRHMLRYSGVVHFMINICLKTVTADYEAVPIFGNVFMLRPIY